MRFRYGSLLVAFLFIACSSADDAENTLPEDVLTDDGGTDADSDGGETDADAEPDAEPDAETSYCGDGVVDEGEACDLGEDNAEDGNCLPDCTWAEEQYWVVSAAEVQAEIPFDGRGVEIEGAPAGNGAWGTSSTDINEDGVIKFELYLDPTRAPFDILGPVTLGDIEEIAYHTTKPGKENSADFTLILYTRRLEDSTSTSFFEHKLNGIPKQARELDAPSDTWNRWSTKAGPNQLTFADQPVTGTYTGKTLPTLDELTADKFDWSGAIATAPATEIDYASQEILFFAIHTDSGASTSEFEGLLDKVSVRLKDGRIVTADLEP